MDSIEKVLINIDSMKDEIIQAVSSIVKIPSINPKYPGVNYDDVIGGESNANEFIAEIYSSLGAEVDIWSEEPKRNNVVGVIKGSSSGKSLIFNGHIDTVPTGRAEDWKFSDPFSGEIFEDRIYGRGARDMKAGLISQAMAAKALKKSGVNLKGDLILESVVGEEVMDHEAGTSATIKRGYRADAAIVAEPSASAEDPLCVVPVSPGVAWVTLTCIGKASHASNRGETIRAGGPGWGVGVNAIDKGQFLLDSLLKLEQEWGLTKKHHLFNPGHFTLLPGVIHGGPHGVDVPFIISEYCKIEYAIWHHPHETLEDVKSEFEEFVKNASALDEWLRENPPEITWNLHWPPYDTPEDHPICSTIAQSHEKAAIGTKFEGPAIYRGFYAVDDATFLNANGIPSVTYGPGHIHQAHMVDEYVNIDEVIASTKTYALTAMDWCGVSI